MLDHHWIVRARNFARKALQYAQLHATMLANQFFATNSGRNLTKFFSLPAQYVQGRFISVHRYEQKILKAQSYA